MGLTPRHKEPGKISLEDLDRYLKAVIDNSGLDNAYAIINPTMYLISEQELYSQLTQNGYNVDKDSALSWRIT